MSDESRVFLLNKLKDMYREMTSVEPDDLPDSKTRSR
jgi:hypothetical protein